MIKIYGQLIDEQGRCVHYHSQLDIIANQCNSCHKFYACFNCHNELENHDFSPVSLKSEQTVLCGNCQQTFTYQTYSNLSECSSCQAKFNPSCSLHAEIYSYKEKA